MIDSGIFSFLTLCWLSRFCRPCTMQFTCSWAMSPCCVLSLDCRPCTMQFTCSWAMSPCCVLSLDWSMKWVWHSRFSSPPSFNIVFVCRNLKCDIVPGQWERVYILARTWKQCFPFIHSLNSLIPDYAKTLLQVYFQTWGGFNTKTPMLQHLELGEMPLLAFLFQFMRFASSETWINLVRLQTVGLWG